MLAVLWQLTKGYHLRPWASPYLWWRIETYSGQDADDVTFQGFWREVWRSRRPFLHYLKWAAQMPKNQNRRETRRSHFHS